MIYLIIIIAIFIMIMFPVIAIFTGKLQLLRLSTQREQAMQIADAGINYYQWHLAHFQTDYQDGTGVAGPYVHEYIDRDKSFETILQNKLQGFYDDLEWILPPSNPLIYKFFTFS